VGEKPRAIHAQRMRQQQLGFEAVAEGIGGAAQYRANVGHVAILAFDTPNARGSPRLAP
jgi:hypothetical protein